jgi:hypothetical protein
MICYFEVHTDDLQEVYIRLVLTKIKFDCKSSEQKLIQNVIAIGTLVSETEYTDEQIRPGNCALIFGRLYTKRMSSNNLRNTSNKTTGHKKLEIK